MAKRCAKCDKTVYPAEELKCLEKTWHKMCFKCTECNMTLNMKNYKGYDKMPYCNAHYPQLKATVVADTPEMKRYDQMTKQQSQVVYHKDYEASKGTMISVAEDPEMMRMRQVTNVISQASYTDHGRDVDSDETSYTRPMRSSSDDNDGYRPPYNPAAQMGRMLPVSGDNTAPPPPQAQQQNTGPLYRALYDYDAQDDDEVSFLENDIICNVQPVDDGWVLGVVQKNNLKGMIPSNYIGEME